MTIILITYLILLLFWVVGLWAAGYHAFIFHLPGDMSIAAFVGFLFASGVLFLLVFNWFLLTYFKGIS